MAFVELDLGGGGGGATLFSADIVVVVIVFVMIWAGAGVPTPLVVLLLDAIITWGGSLTSADLGLRLFGDFLSPTLGVGVILFEISALSSTIIPTSLRVVTQETEVPLLF